MPRNIFNSKAPYQCQSQTEYNNQAIISSLGELSTELKAITSSLELSTEDQTIISSLKELSTELKAVLH